MLLRALLRPPVLQAAVVFRASRSSSAASRPLAVQAQAMDPLESQTAERFASGAQASPSGGGGGAAAGGVTRVAVAQMTSGSSPDQNFETVSRLAKVCSRAAYMCGGCTRCIAACALPAAAQPTLPPAPMLQEAAARGCKMLFLPENVSFLGSSFTEVRAWRASSDGMRRG